MICPSCKSTNNIILDSKLKISYIRRRRKCQDCGTRWKTENDRLFERGVRMTMEEVMNSDKFIKVLRNNLTRIGYIKET